LAIVLVAQVQIQIQLVKPPILLLPGEKVWCPILSIENDECNSVADPDPGSCAFLTPGSGMDKKSRSVSGMNNPDHISERSETIF
jgi:hypothetical protein